MHQVLAGDLAASALSFQFVRYFLKNVWLQKLQKELKFLLKQSLKALFIENTNCFKLFPIPLLSKI
jgi:hypothetical protein